MGEDSPRVVDVAAAQRDEVGEVGIEPPLGLGFSMAGSSPLGIAVDTR
jgi:hypothetical protein